MNQVSRVSFVFALAFIIRGQVAHSQAVQRTEISMTSNDGTQAAFIQFMKKDEFTVLESRNIHSTV